MRRNPARLGGRKALEANLRMASGLPLELHMKALGYGAVVNKTTSVTSEIPAFAGVPPKTADVNRDRLVPRQV